MQHRSHKKIVSYSLRGYRPLKTGVRFGLLCILAGISGVLLCGLIRPVHTAATAGINQELSFEGKIVNSTGQNIPDGTYNMEFRIYTGCTNEPTNSTGCTAVWTEDYLKNNSQGVTFTSGTYQVNLGSICAFTTTTCENNSNTAVDWNSYPLYLSLQIGNTSNCSVNNPGSSLFTADCGGDGVMNPFVLLTSTPYAMNANAVGGKTVSQLGQLAANQTWTGTNLMQNNSTTGLQIQDSSNSANVLTVDTSGDVVDVGSNASLVHASQLYVKNTNSANRALILQGAASQSVDILDIYNSSGSFVSGYDVNGNEYLNGLLQTGTTSAVGDIKLKDGTSNNYDVSVLSQALTASYTVTLPAAGATGSQCIQSTSGSTSTSTSLQWGACGSGGATNSAISEVNTWGTFNTSPSTSSTTLNNSPANIGDLMIVYTALGNSLTTSAVSGGGVTNWSRVVYSASTGDGNEMWIGQVTSTGAKTISVTFSGTETNNYEVNAQEFTTTGVSAATNWSVTTAGGYRFAGSSTTDTFPTLVSSPLTNEAYVGYSSLTGTGSTTPCTSGFTCALSAWNNNMTWNTNLSSNTSYTPTMSQSPAGTTNSVAAILIAYGGLSTSYINNSTTVQSGNLNVQAATSGSVAGVFEANAAGSGDVLDLKNGSGANVATVGSTGAALFENSTDSTTAFQIQNHSGNALLTADTTNTAIVLGKDTTPGAITVRGGAASGSNVAGANITFAASNGTGTGGSGSFIFQTAVAGTTGSTANTLATALTIGASTVTFAKNTLILPASDGSSVFQIQNSGATANLFTADTSGLNITVAGTTSTFATLIITNSHLESTQGTAPSMGSITSCGSGGTAPTTAITAGSTDAAGSFTITTVGTTSTGSGCSVTLTFNKAYAITPKSIIVSPDNALGGASAPTTLMVPAVSTKGTGSFTVKLLGTDATGVIYGYDYWVVE